MKFTLKHKCFINKVDEYEGMLVMAFYQVVVAKTFISI